VADERFGSRLAAAAGAFASKARNPSVRRAQLAFLEAWTAESAGFTVALGIVAYRDGGATAVGLVGLLRMVPSAVVAPLAAPLADRGRGNGCWSGCRLCGGRRDNPGRVEQLGGNFDVIIDGVGGAHPRARRRARGPAWRRGEHRDPAWRRNGQLPCEVLRPGARRGDLHAESSRRARVTRQRGQRPHSAITTRRSGVASASSSRAPHLLQNSASSDTPAPQARQLNGCSCVKATDQPPRRQRRPCRPETTENMP